MQDHIPGPSRGVLFGGPVCGVRASIGDPFEGAGINITLSGIITSFLEFLFKLGQFIRVFSVWVAERIGAADGHLLYFRGA